MRRNKRTITCVFLLLFISVSAMSQDRVSRGSIPETLIRPARGEAPRYPIDTVIGELGQGSASTQSYNFARGILAGLLSGNMEHSSLSSINSVMRESYLTSIAAIRPVSFRIGGGREEADGAVSFLVRFIGVEQGITGELYIREKRIEKREATPSVRKTDEEDEEGGQIAEEVDEPSVSVTVSTSLVFEDLLLDEAQSRETEQQSSEYRLDFYPYERFF